MSQQDSNNKNDNNDIIKYNNDESFDNNAEFDDSVNFDDSGGDDANFSNADDEHNAFEENDEEYHNDPLNADTNAPDPEYENQGDDGGDAASDGNPLVEKLKQPKNLIIIGVFALFALFVAFKMFSSGDKKPQKKQAQSQDDIPSDVVMSIDKIQKQTAANNAPQASQQALPLPPPKIPEITSAPKIPELKIDVDTIPKETNIPDLPPPTVALPPLPKIEDKSSKKKDEAKKDDSIPDFDETLTAKKRNKITEQDKLPPIFDLSGTGPEVTKKEKKDANDFIFIDSHFDTEQEDSGITSKKLQNPGNLIAQGRLIDAILETAVNSSIPGNVRAIVSHDVYGEMGRNILIPKGTRLYGTYQAAATGATRMNIAWSRIMRPDNVVTSINSFASDQFGRAGIAGDVDRKYGESIASAVLLSTIPIVGAIATNAITGARNSTTTSVGAATGTTTYTSDPINVATTAFTNQISKAADQIISQMINTQSVITLPQGTRVTILVNQDMNLPSYKSITRTSSEITSE